MVFNSMEFLIFFPIVVLIYYIIPLKYRYIWLLISSYYFYYTCSFKYVVLLMGTTLITYGCGRMLDNIHEKDTDCKRVVFGKIILGICIVTNLAPLFLYKYLDFFLINVNKVINVENSPLWELNLLLPVGISFYTFQALGYVIDVYRGDIRAEKNILKYGLFVSFFPLILSGPIERAKNMLHQIDNPSRFHAENARAGLLSIAWGLFLKIVAADRIANHINPVFADYIQYDGMVLLMASILFAFQIYCDFQGYSQMAIGVAQVLGYRVKSNFAAPYMAFSIQDFWRRWHISLTSWFRDYLYISLGGNRKGKLRKYINNMIVFLISGLWHGAGWKFVVWGGLNGAFIVLEDMTKEIRKWICEKTGIKTDTTAVRIWNRFVTFILVDLCWIFFNANSLGDGISIIKKIVCDFRIRYFFTEEFWLNFGTIENFAIMAISLLIVFIIDKAVYQGIDVKQTILNQQIVVRWGLYLTMILIILFWGVYGEEYVQTQFIYFQF